MESSGSHWSRADQSAEPPPGSTGGEESVLQLRSGMICPGWPTTSRPRRAPQAVSTTGLPALLVRVRWTAEAWRALGTKPPLCPKAPIWAQISSSGVPAIGIATGSLASIRAGKRRLGKARRLNLQAGGHRFDPGWLHRRKCLQIGWFLAAGGTRLVLGFLGEYHWRVPHRAFILRGMRDWATCRQEVTGSIPVRWAKLLGAQTRRRWWLRRWGWADEGVSGGGIIGGLRLRLDRTGRVRVALSVNSADALCGCREREQGRPEIRLLAYVE
jgi:hypothetical protein